MAMNPASSTLHLGEHVLLTATLRYLSGAVVSGRMVVWSSSNPELAVVDRTGLVTALASGDVSVQAVIDGYGGGAHITVVRAPVATIAITPSVTALPVGTNQQLTTTLRDEFGHVLPGRLVTWTSSDPPLASLDGIGVVTAVGLGGSLTITAASDGQPGSAQVTVVPFSVATVSVDPSSREVVAGATSRLAATLRDIGGRVLLGRSVTWSSSDTSVATVDATGVVRGVRPGGPVTISAFREGQTGAAQITVVPPK